MKGEREMQFYQLPCRLPAPEHRARFRQVALCNLCASRRAAFTCVCCTHAMRLARIVRHGQVRWFPGFFDIRFRRGKHWPTKRFSTLPTNFDQQHRPNIGKNKKKTFNPKLGLQIHANKGFVLPTFSPSSEHFNACQPERALQRTLRFYVSSFLCAREASV